MSDSSFDFNPTGREHYQQAMRNAGYVEISEFPAHMDGYSCASCEYFTKNTKSPTGFWCKKLGFPDRGNGCCDQWEAVPGLLKDETA